MFHTLFELQEKEKNEKNKPKTANKFTSNMQKERSPEDNYYGKGNKAYDHYNKKKTEDNNEKYEKTKNKIMLVVYRNGFILNNGPFRDKAIPENNKFMEEVEKGNIPDEILEKGITDLGILLINRKTETYYPPINIPPITQIMQITQINPINPITVNPINQFNQNPNIINYPYPYQYQYQLQNPYNIIGNHYLNKIESRPRSRTQALDLPPQTPIGTRNVRNNIFAPITVNRNDIIRQDRQISSVPKKKEDKNEKNNFDKKTFQTFNNFKQMEYLKEEEEKKKKQKEKEIAKNLNKKEENKKLEKEKGEEKEEKKFTVFGGQGKAIGNINIEGLNIDKEVKNVVDIYRPVCTISIRLFNGEIIKSDFNYIQTLRDIYYFVRRISGSNNFTLLDGFPPRPLRDYDRTIGELNLQNTILTQRIN